MYLWLQRQEVPHAKVEPQHIDLGDLSTIRAFTEKALSFPGHQLDVLVNNAGAGHAVHLPLIRKRVLTTCSVVTPDVIWKNGSGVGTLQCRCHGDAGDADKGRV